MQVIQAIIRSNNTQVLNLYIYRVILGLFLKFTFSTQVNEVGLNQKKLIKWI